MNMPSAPDGCDATSADKPLLNRRFLRLQAVQHLYAFYVCKHANYACAQDRIRAAFVLDVFADPPEDKAHLAQEAQQALDLLAAALATPHAPLPAFEAHSSRVRQAVTEGLTSYQKELAKDVRRLEEGLTEAKAKIKQAYVRIWQLLVEWAHMAKKHTTRPKLSQPQAASPSVCLSSSHILQRLQEDEVLAQLVQQHAAGWGDDVPTLESWYNQFIKKNPEVQRLLAAPLGPEQDQQLLSYLIEDLIFDNEVIQDFLSGLDLNWTTHKRIVRKMLHQGLAAMSKDLQPSSTLPMFDLNLQEGTEPCFYAALIQRTLDKDGELEALIAQNSTNWTVDRVVLLDKTMIKLALCEMLCFPAIPVKVSINEYIDLSKAYSMPKSSQFVNGLLDAVANTLHKEGGNSPQNVVH